MHKESIRYASNRPHSRPATRRTACVPPVTEVRVILAPNTGPMTGSGTNTYILGRGDVVMIDPGPDDPSHRAALLAALGPTERVAAILITHSHVDHTALAPAIRAVTGAPVWGAGRAGSGRSATMATWAARNLAGGGEGFDRSYCPDRVLRQCETLQIGDLTIEVIATPGHTGCHLSFACGDLLFSGDTAMGWSTSLVSPPDGDMAAYMTSLNTLAARMWRVIHPGHGPAILWPAARLADLIAHRKIREAEILAALSDHGPATCDMLAARIYAATPSFLLPAAARNVLAHLIDLTDRGMVSFADGDTPDGIFARI